jgi:colanic acid biosynthesis glycosyl transferase WcaI
MTAPEPAIRGKLVFVNRFYAPDQSATSRMLTDLAVGLARRGFEVHVVCSRQLYEDPEARLAPSEQMAGVLIHRIATTRFGRARWLGRAIDYGSFYASCAMALIGLLGRGDIVVAKTDPPLVSLICALAARWRRAALINWQQDIFPEIASLLGANPLPRWVDTLLRRCRNASLRSAAMNVAIGSRMRDYLEACGTSASRLCIIENWADGALINPRPAESSALRARLSLRDRFVVGYSGNLGRAHEFATLLGAAKALHPDRAFVFLIVGGGAKMNEFKQAVAAEGLDNVRFLPYQPSDRLEDSLAAADVHFVSLLPALEGLIVPSKFYGILAAGRPVIFAGDPRGELANIILGSGCGLTVSVGDSCQLAAELSRLRSAPAACAAMGGRARSLLIERYEARHAIDRWCEILARAQTESPRRARSASRTLRSMDSS